MLAGMYIIYVCMATCGRREGVRKKREGGRGEFFTPDNGSVCANLF